MHNFIMRKILIRLGPLSIINTHNSYIKIQGPGIIHNFTKVKVLNNNNSHRFVKVHRPVIVLRIFSNNEVYSEKTWHICALLYW